MISALVIDDLYRGEDLLKFDRALRMVGPIKARLNELHRHEIEEHEQNDGVTTVPTIFDF